MSQRPHRRRLAGAAGLILCSTVAPGWILLSWFVGVGLVFAGLSGFCGMARLLALMPWNKVSL